MSKNLAHNLLYLRKAKGLTQAQLSILSSVPRATLAHLESGQSNPSLKTLTSVAKALCITLEELLATPHPTCHFMKSEDLPRIIKSQGNASIITLLPHPTPGLQFERIDLKGHAFLSGTPHAKGTREYFTCIQGTMSVSVEGDAYALEEGDVLAFPGDYAHLYRNLLANQSSGISIIMLG